MDYISILLCLGLFLLQYKQDKHHSSKATILSAEIKQFTLININQQHDGDNRRRVMELETKMVKTCAAAGDERSGDAAGEER
ncbi:ATP dependent DNA ligase domain protein [Sesbania bispinosa]|nr:ATP dependent DNA ligase domain protein [Sesbania bispinosa]